MIKNEIHYLSREDSEKLILNIKSLKYKLIVLLMLDCGLRVSEAVSIQLKYFDFKKRILSIP
jgi:integrase